MALFMSVEICDDVRQALGADHQAQQNPNHEQGAPTGHEHGRQDNSTRAPRRRFGWRTWMGCACHVTEDEKQAKLNQYFQLPRPKFWVL
jgi:uncharacterized membrane protein YccC